MKGRSAGMSQRRQIARVAWIFIGLQLLVGLNGPFGIGLCVAEDGHTTIELTHADTQCGADARRHHSDMEVLDSSEFERHPCRDVPLLQSRPCTRAADARLVPPAAAALPVVPPCLPQGSVQVSHIADHDSAPPLTLNSIRSIVLII